MIDPAQVEAKITPRTKAIIAVDFAGQPCDYDSLRNIADRNNLVLVADACHALGAEYKGQKTGSLADLNVFSFHPVKHITTGEGGMITTDDAKLAERMRLFRNHGITRKAPSIEPWFYEVVDLGYNYRITDIQCTLGISQLQKLPEFLWRRREIAAQYDEALADISGIEPLGLRSDVLSAEKLVIKAQSLDRKLKSDFQPRNSQHAYHLYVVKIDFKILGIARTATFAGFRENGIAVNVHYIPVHLQPFYRNRFGTGPGLCPTAEAAYEQIISLPLFPGMTDENVENVIKTVPKVIDRYKTGAC